MATSKKNLSIVKMLSFFMLLSIAACESKTETKVETTPVVVKDTMVIDTNVTARPRVPGN